MCSYCGCGAEPLIAALTDDHALIADLAYRVVQALDSADTGRAESLMWRLAQAFASHSMREEAGLFAEMVAAGEAAAEVRQLVADHQRLRPLLASPRLARSPHQLRAALADLERHARTEENDLFPYALQVLPASSWDRINRTGAPRPAAHQ